MIENPCIYCGKSVLEANKRICEECRSNPKKKNPIRNLQIISKYDSSIDNLDRLFSRFLEDIDYELQKLSILKDKFSLNDTNANLLNSKMGNFVKLKEKTFNFQKQMRETLI